MERKAVSGILVILLLIGMLTLAFNFQKVRAEPTTWTVDDDGPADFSSIQGAINSPLVMNGDTICVYNGTYYENVVVNKSLSLIGENSGTTIIDGSGNGTIVTVTVSNVTIRNFSIRNGGSAVDEDAGIKINWLVRNHNISYNTIANNYYGISTQGFKLSCYGNTLANNTCGINLQHSSGNSLFDNVVTNNGYGVYLSHSDNNSIYGNTITNNTYCGIELYWSADNNTINKNSVTNNSLFGVLLAYSSNNMLKHNSIVDNCYNFMAYGSTLSHFIQNIDSSNTVNGKPIYYWVNQRNKQVPVDAGYVAAVNSTGITVNDLNLTGNGDGVLFAYTTESTIENVSASNNDCGISLAFSSNNTIFGNRAASNNAGIFLEYSSDNTIINNMITDNSEGIGLYDYSSYNRVSGNNITNSIAGIWFYHYCSNNSITGNNIASNGWGIDLHYSLNNIIYHNNFINNVQQVHVEPSGYANFWDNGYPSGGNYWSDYEDKYPNATEWDSSGIWDTPYVVDENNQDNYPLKKPYIAGDVDYDGIVKTSDLRALSEAYGATPDSPNWNVKADINDDLIVDVIDLFTLSKNYGKTA